MTADLLNTADALILGDGTKAVEAYLGTVRVWPTGPALPPGNISGSSSATDRATITWSRVPGAYEYVVYQGGVEVARVQAPATSYTATGLAPATSYSFQVAAVTMLGQGHLSPPTVVRTPAPAAPHLTLSPSTTSAEVYFTTVTFTATTSNAALGGSYTLQRQLPDQGWVDVAAITPGTPLALANAIPAGAYTIGWFGASASFRVHFVGSGTGAGLDVYSPVVTVSFSYRSRPSYPTISLRSTQGTIPALFMNTWYLYQSRLEFNVPAELNGLVSTATFAVSDSEGYYCTGDTTNPYVQWFSVDAEAQQGGGPRGPVGLAWGGTDWMYANNILQDFSPFGWRLQGATAVPNATWGIGVNKLIGGVLTLNYVDGYPSHVSDYTILFG
jgi:hypothetical protein